MAIQYAKDEFLIERYDYCNGVMAKGRKHEDIIRVLYVTNKRIIHEVATAGAIERKEIPLTKATYISSSFTLCNRPIYLLIIGIILLVAGITSFMLYLTQRGYAPYKILYMIAGVACALMGLIFVFAFFTRQNGTAINITIENDSPHETVLEFGSSSIKKRKHGTTTSKTISFNVNRAEAYQLIDSLGATILNAQNSQRDIVNEHSIQKSSPFND